MREGSSTPQTERLSNTAFRAIETRLLEWPGVSRAAINGEREAIVGLVTVIAKTRARGTTSRTQVRDDLDAVKKYASQLARLLREPTIASLMPALLGRLAWGERPELGYAQVLDPEGFERGWWALGQLPQTTAMVTGLLEHLAEGTARQLKQMPKTKRGGSIEDERDVPGANLICAAGALGLLEQLSGAQPSTRSRALSTLCQALWEAAAGNHSVPDWNHALRQVLQNPRPRRAELAVFTAQLVFFDRHPTDTISQ